MRGDLRKTLIIAQAAIIALGIYEIVVCDNKLGIAFAAIAITALCTVIRNKNS